MSPPPHPSPLHPSVLHLFRAHPHRLAALTAHLPPHLRPLPPLPLPPPPAPVRPAFLLLALLDASSSSAATLTLVPLTTTTTTTTTAAACVPSPRLPTPLLLAPPPPPSLRALAVYIRDFRVIPAAAAAAAPGPPLLEALLRDLVPLDPLPHPAPARPLAFYPPPRPPRPLRARVAAKSPVVATRRRRRRRGAACFLLELAAPPAEDALHHDPNPDPDPAPAAVVVVFRADAVRWWPFLPLGAVCVFSGLTLARLPSYARRVVMRADSPAFSVVSAPAPVGVAPPPCKRPRLGLLAPLPTPAPSARLVPTRPRAARVTRARMVTYEGDITRVLPDGRYVLDACVMLHLGAAFEGGVAGGPETLPAFREGARIEVSNVLAVRRGGGGGGGGGARGGRMASLFPTGRTVVSFVYFGGVEGLKAGRGGSKESVWRGLWKRWGAREILWAEEVYERLVQKFGAWLQSGEGHGDGHTDGHAVDAELAKYLLGWRGETGLVQCVMHRQGGAERLMSVDAPSSRNIYQEFLSPPLPGCLKENWGAPPPILPTVREVADGVRRLCKAAVRRRIARHEAYGRCVAPRRDRDVFRFSQVGAVLIDGDGDGGAGVAVACKVAAGRKDDEDGRVDVGLVGLLQGPSRGDGRLVLSDATGVVEVKVIGVLQPALLGAIVYVSDFCVVVEREEHGVANGFTVVFDASAAGIVLDGPYAATPTAPMGFTATTPNRRPAVGGGDTPGSRARRSSRFSRQLTQGVTTQSVGSAGDSGEELAVVDTPLVCLHVSKVLCSASQVTAEGRLIAVLRDRSEDEWSVVSDDSGGFWPCALVLSGTSALQIVPVLDEGGLFALSCTELYGVGDPLAFLRAEAATQVRRRGRLKLSMQLETKVPWVENLGRGHYMRFKAEVGGGGNALAALQTQSLSALSVEGAHYEHIARALESFRDKDEKLLSEPVWKAYEWGNRQAATEEKVLMLRGRVESFSDDADASLQDEAGTVYNLVLSDVDHGVFRITISFYEPRARPHGIIVGMVVEARRVVRVAQHNARRFRYVGTAATVIRILSPPPDHILHSLCRACRPFDRSLAHPARDSHLPPFQHLASFAPTREAAAGRSCGAGVVRFQSVAVEYLHLWISADERTCALCAVAHEGDIWNVDARVRTRVDDGSAEAGLEAGGFGLAVQLLGATEEECAAMKALALARGQFDMSAHAARGFAAEGGGGSEGAMVATVAKMMCRRGCGGVGMVRNASVEEQGVEMRCFGLGFGRRLVTGCWAAEVLVECLALWKECWCKGRCRCGEGEGGVRAVETLRWLMEAGGACG